MAAPTHPLLTAEIIDGTIPVIQVRGELDLSTAGRLCRTVQAVAGARRRTRVLLDLSGLGEFLRVAPSTELALQSLS